MDCSGRGAAREPRDPAGEPDRGVVDMIRSERADANYSKVVECQILGAVVSL